MLFLLVLWSHHVSAPSFLNLSRHKHSIILESLHLDIIKYYSLLYCLCHILSPIPSILPLLTCSRIPPIYCIVLPLSALIWVFNNTSTYSLFFLISEKPNISLSASHAVESISSAKIDANSWVLHFLIFSYSPFYHGPTTPPVHLLTYHLHISNAFPTIHLHISTLSYY